MKEENGPLIALVIFILLSALFGYWAYGHYTEVVGDEQNGGPPSMDKKIKAERDEIAVLEGDVKKARQDIDLLGAGIFQQKEEYSYQKNLYDAFEGEEQRRIKLHEVMTKNSQQADELNDKINTKKNETLSRITTETSDVRERMDRELQVLTTDKEASAGRQRVLNEEFEADKKKYLASKNYEQSTLDESKSILADLTQRDIERAEVLTEVDGKVVLADVVTNVVIIDIGTAVGVKNGMRFEAFTIRPGNKKVVKCYLEVKKADVSKSECIIVRRPVLLPKDPLSEYVAGQPEEMFSPYQESGKKGATAQPLSGKPRPTVMENRQDPIVEGDFIQNPFFSTKKTLTFYIAGAKEIQNERQKSAIRYKAAEIKAVVEAYGGKVSATPDVGCDYMIAQKSPQEGTDAERAEFIRAKDLGLPVVYEWELFRFLENK
ncbi:MAG TPA: BRCT domain-containing protein [Planctomycetota bacterium]|nr:BRCT domain-containing protein [Planctomycetota bacterium]